MRFIFCSDYWNPLAPDAAYEAEVNVAQKLGLSYSLMNFEALVEQQDAARAVRRVQPADSEEVAIYRGWMLKYWEEGEYSHDTDNPPLQQFREIAQRVQSRFFTLDVAQKRDGSWTIVEPGDGQVAGLPERADKETFYQALADKLKK